MGRFAPNVIGRECLNRLWQKAMLRIARADRIRRTLEPIISSSLIERYIAGSSPASGIAQAREFERQKLRSSLFFVGEYLKDENRCGSVIRSTQEMIGLLAEAALDVHISIDPTAIGYLIDAELCSQNAIAIATEIAGASRNRTGVHCLMLDMEDQSLIDYTIRLHNKIKALGLPVALTLQAYLRRTEKDLEYAIATASRVRLVKGAFAAASAIAYLGKRTVAKQYMKLASQMLRAASTHSQFYPIFATHDEGLQRRIVDLAGSERIPRDRFEFEMLMGVRPELAVSLASEGFRVRLYVPCGPDWWGYVNRRLGESPRNALLLVKAICS